MKLNQLAMKIFLPITSDVMVLKQACFCQHSSYFHLQSLNSFLKYFELTFCLQQLLKWALGKLNFLHGLMLYDFSILILSKFCQFSNSFFTFQYLCNNLFHYYIKNKLLVMFSLSLLKSGTHCAFNLLSQSRHFILLLLNKFSFSSDNLFVSGLHVLFSFFF